MDANALDAQARRNMRASRLRNDCVAYGATRREVNNLDLAALFELRGKLLSRLMSPPGAVAR